MDDCGHPLREQQRRTSLDTTSLHPELGLGIGKEGDRTTDKRLPSSSSAPARPHDAGLTSSLAMTRSPLARKPSVSVESDLVSAKKDVDDGVRLGRHARHGRAVAP